MMGECDDCDVDDAENIEEALERLRRLWIASDCDPDDDEPVTDGGRSVAYVIVDRRTGLKPSSPWSDAWDVSEHYDPGVEDDPVFEQHAITWGNADG